MLCRVKAEAVNAAVHTFLQQPQHTLLHIAVGGVQIGHAEMAVGHLIAAVIVDSVGFAVIIRGVFQIAFHVFAQVGITAAGGVVCHVVCDNIHDHLNVIFVRLRAQRFQFGFCPEPRSAVGYTQRQRLVELPPLTARRAANGILRELRLPDGIISLRGAERSMKRTGSRQRDRKRENKQ